MRNFSLHRRSKTTHTLPVVRLLTWSRRIAVGFSVALAIAGEAARAQQPATSLPVVVADFNRDGIPDVLIPSLTSATATIAFGSLPYGTFSANAKALTLPPACQSNTGPTVVGDFNNDGFTDVAFDCGLTSGVAGVMLGRGDGTFAPAQMIQGVAQSSSAIQGDFNHDGKLDIVTLGTLTGSGTSNQVLQFFAGNGDGTFAAGITTTFPAGSSYVSPVAADVNADGYPDIVMGSFAAGKAPTLAVFGNNKDGTFGIIAQGNSSPSASAAVGTAADSLDSAVLVGSFFVKGSVDFAVPDLGTTSGVFVVRNTSTATAFSLGTAAKTLFPGLTGALIGSFTGSGLSDLLLSNATSQSVLSNDGTGNFAANFTNLTLSSTAVGMAAVDSNGDGYADIYSAVPQTGGGIQVVVDQVTGSATATSQPFSLAVGTPAIAATWLGNALISGSSATGTQTVEAFAAASTTTVTSSQNPSAVGAPVTLTVTVAGPSGTTLVPTGTVTVMDGTTALGSGPLGSLGTFTLSTSSLTAGIHAITASYAGDTSFTASVSAPLTQTVNGASPVVTFSGPATTPPGSQPSLAVTIVNPYPVDLTATLTLSFASLANPPVDDPAIQFADGGRTLTFTIPANSTTVPPIQLQVGTDAGTIMVPLRLTAAGADVTPATLVPLVITVPAAVPVASTVTVTRTGSQLSVAIHGFSNTRELTQAAFHFAAAAGATIDTPDVTANVGQLFTTWYNSDDSIQVGSTFTYTQNFDVSDDAANVGQVTVTLTNSIGASTSVTSQ